MLIALRLVAGRSLLALVAPAAVPVARRRSTRRPLTPAGRDVAGVMTEGDVLQVEEQFQRIFAIEPRLLVLDGEVLSRHRTRAVEAAISSSLLDEREQQVLHQSVLCSAYRHPELGFDFLGTWHWTGKGWHRRTDLNRRSSVLETGRLRRRTPMQLEFLAGIPPIK